MTKLAVLLFVFAASACCISAYPSAIPSGDNVRIVRAALPDPDPHHHRNHGFDGGYGYYGGHNGYRGHQGYGYYGGHHGHHGHGGYGDYNYPQNNGFSNAQASAAAFNTPFGGASFAQANANSGSGGGLFSGLLK